MDLKEPITTQEALDEIIRERLKRKDEQTARQLTDYEDLKKKATEADARLAALTAQLDEANAKVAAGEKNTADLMARISGMEQSALRARIASEYGLPAELADRLNGADDAALRKDAETLKGLMGTRKAAPLAATEMPDASGEDAAIRQMLGGLGVKK